MKITTTTGPKLIRKSINERLVAPPIIMLGGSPINVAVPPILAVNTSVIKNGTGFNPNVSVITNVTGAINKIVVTLSSKAEATAVTTEK